MANSSNFYTESQGWGAREHQAAAAALGFAVRVQLGTVGLGTPSDFRLGADVEAERLLVYLARQAAHHANLAEAEDERMARVLAAQVSYGNGPGLSAEEIEQAERGFCDVCSSLPCRCEHKGGN